jgi:hypothetical protein
MNVARAVTATFSARPRITLTRTGDGLITSDPAGLDCGATCGAYFDPGSLVTLTASPGADSYFPGFGSAYCPVDASTCTLQMIRDYDIVAFFLPKPGIDLSFAGTGTGSVSSTPSGMNCTTACTGLFASPSLVTLTATPDPGSVFERWTGECIGTVATTCNVTVTRRVGVGAIFTHMPIISVTRIGNGSGRITSTPDGIDCGADCTEAIRPGTEININAVADAGSEFMGWSGACTTTLPDCRLGALATDVTLTANFRIRSFPLTAHVDGGGTLTTSPVGISCGADCTEDYLFNTVITLTASPAAGSQFQAWLGACNGGAPTCQVTMSEARDVTAKFVVAPSPSPAGGGGGGKGGGRLDWLALAAVALLVLGKTVSRTRWGRSARRTGKTPPARRVPTTFPTA